jgi:S-adenosylmethionine-diacylglycerol 3-amino-3-carboxypropyl transferase
MNAATVTTPAPLPLTRNAGIGATDGPLHYAQVREDPRLELEALGDTDGVTVVVGSGGCTALSLLGATRGQVVAVDVNRTQNHLLELKAAAVALGSGATGFLGGAPSVGRGEVYGSLRASLGPEARAFWDAHPREIGDGVLRAGRTERFVAAVVQALKLTVHRQSTIDALLACPDLDAQRAFYEATWNTWRWRALFAVLLNRAVFRNVDPMFFQHVGSQSFSRYFLDKLEHTLTALPVRDNYFLHFMLTGRYPDSAVPPYLEGSLTGDDLARLTVVDGEVTGWLRDQPDGSVARFALSNVAEWMAPDAVDALFGEVVRTAAPGARVCFRNFVGWTEIPARWRGSFAVSDWGDAAILRDRSGVQRRIVLGERIS